MAGLPGIQVCRNEGTGLVEVYVLQDGIKQVTLTLNVKAAVDVANSLLSHADALHKLNGQALKDAAALRACREVINSSG